MSRNNSDRFSSEEEESDVPQENNKSLSFAVPTEAVDLPSRGKFYPKDHPLHNKEYVEIRYMTTADEDLLNNRSLIKKGIALDRMLQNLIVDKNIKVNDLLIGDKNALIIAARSTAFGDEYNASVTCANCFSNVKYTFNLSELKNKPIKEGASLNTLGRVHLKLPASGAEVELRLLTGTDEINLRTTEEKRKKHNLPSSTITDFFKTIIVSVNGNEDASNISQFVSSMVTKDSSYIKKEFQEFSPNVDLKQHFECSECLTEMEVSIPFSVEFFWPER